MTNANKYISIPCWTGTLSYLEAGARLDSILCENRIKGMIYSPKRADDWTYRVTYIQDLIKKVMKDRTSCVISHQSEYTHSATFCMMILNIKYTEQVAQWLEWWLRHLDREVPGSNPDRGRMQKGFFITWFRSVMAMNTTMTPCRECRTHGPTHLPCQYYRLAWSNAMCRWYAKRAYSRPSSIWLTKIA